MFKIAAVATVLAALACPSHAADTRPLPYAGLDVGTTKLEGLSGHHTSVGAYAGYEFDPQAAAELGYRRLASLNVMGADVDARQTHLSILGIRSLGAGFDAFARLGVSHLSAGATYHGAVASASSNKVLYGVGLSYKFSSIVSARLELQRSGNDVDNLSLSTSFKF